MSEFEEIVSDLVRSKPFFGTASSLSSILKPFFGEMSAEALRGELETCSSLSFFETEDGWEIHNTGDKANAKDDERNDRYNVENHSAMDAMPSIDMEHTEHVEVPNEDGMDGEETSSGDSTRQGVPLEGISRAYYEAQGTEFDPEAEALRFLEVIRKPGEAVEIRCLPKSRESAVHSGLFTDLKQAAKEAIKASGQFKGVYFTLNPVAPGLEPHAIRRSGADTKLTSDDQIANRSWLLIDIEGNRPEAKANNATDEEIVEAAKAGDKIKAHLFKKTKCLPLELLSGNGIHLLYRLEADNDDNTYEAVRAFLAALRERFQTEGATIDVTVSNAARISKLPGTLTKKGSHSILRPQRVARVLGWDVEGDIAPFVLDWFFKKRSAETSGAAVQKRKSDSHVSELERARLWLEKRDPAVSGQNGDEWTLKTCCNMVLGLKLSDEDALTVLAPWNARCQPPWSDRELREKIRNARKYGKQEVGNILNAAFVKTNTEKPIEELEVERKLNKMALTDLGNAEAVIMLYGKRLRWHATLGKWLNWNGKCWAEDRDNKAQAWANKSALRRREAASLINDEEKRKAAVSHAFKSESARARDNALAQVKAWKPLIVHSDTMDRDPWLLTVQNGTIDLRTGKLQAHNPDDYITKTVATNYDPEATCPLWLSFLDTAMGGNPDLIKYLQQAAGYSLTGTTKEHAVFILYGSGRNGKSLFVEVLNNLLGDYSRTARSQTFTETATETISNDIARLDGARLVKCSETNEQFRLDEALIKGLSGEDTVTARFLHREYFEFRPKFKVWLSTNHRPIIRGTDCGIWRRIKLVPFSVEIPVEKVDKDLKDKLLLELPGILNWAIRGCLDWQEVGGLREPEAIQKAIKDYQDDSDTVGNFLLELCSEEYPDACEFLSDLYKAYSFWAKEQGVRFPLTLKQLGHKIRDKGFKTDLYGRARKCRVLGLKLNWKAEVVDSPSDGWSKSQVEALSGYTCDLDLC